MKSKYDRALSLLTSDPGLCQEIRRVMYQRNISSINRRPMTLTPRMKELYDFISDFSRANGGVAPSFDEMKDALDLKSKSGVHRMITALEERGAIRRLPNHARAIVCLDNEILEAAQ